MSDIKASPSLLATHNHARHMASRPARSPAEASEQQLWRQIADEIDAYITSEDEQEGLFG